MTVLQQGSKLFEAMAHGLQKIRILYHSPYTIHTRKNTWQKSRFSPAGSICSHTFDAWLQYNPELFNRIRCSLNFTFHQIKLKFNCSFFDVEFSTISLRLASVIFERVWHTVCRIHTHDSILRLRRQFSLKKLSSLFFSFIDKWNVDLHRSSSFMHSSFLECSFWFPKFCCIDSQVSGFASVQTDSFQSTIGRSFSSFRKCHRLSSSQGHNRSQEWSFSVFCKNID